MMRTTLIVVHAASLLMLVYVSDVVASPEEDLSKETQVFLGAQSTAWLDHEVLAVGRWDGTLSLFEPPRPAAYGMPIAGAYTVPARRAIEMIVDIPGDGFVTSNDDTSIALWRRTPEATTAAALTYNEQYGVANAGVAVTEGNVSLLATGHANGWVLIWEVSTGGLTLVRAIDLRSPSPIPSPYPLKNIRGIARWKGTLLVTGSEDGDLCVINAVDGHVLQRKRYSPGAQRGINAISVSGDLLLVVNCAVGSGDNNAWLYRLADSGIAQLHALNLRQDVTRPQVFAFSALLVQQGKRLFWYVATEEGLLWSGRIQKQNLVKVQENGLDVAVPGTPAPSPLSADDDAGPESVVPDELVTQGSREVAPKLGASLAYDEKQQRLAAVGFSILLFRIQPDRPLTLAMVGTSAR